MARRWDGRWYARKVLTAAMHDAVGQHIVPLHVHRLIDLGCGAMPYREHISAHVREYLGVDVPGEPGVDATFDEHGRAPYADGSADVVISTQVLEHVPSPPAYLAEAARLLRPGGLLLLSTHGVWKYHPHPTDLWRWTSEGLRREVEQAGFTVTAFQGVLGRGAIGGQLAQDALVPRLPKRLRTPVAVAMQGLVAALDRLSTPADRDADAGIYLLAATRP